MQRKKKVDWSEAGKKAVKTKKQNEKDKLAAKKLSHDKHSEGGKKAHRETIGPSERGFVKYLIKNGRAKDNEVFLHTGFPDVTVITASGKIQFFEIKPKKGPKEGCLLNPQQNNQKTADKPYS